MTRDRLSGAFILALSILTLGTAVYFLILRPPLLPEDIRYTGVDPTTLPPALLEWLSIVFRTWGGFIAGLGLMLTGIGSSMLTGRSTWLYFATAAGVLIAFGRFLVSNIVLASDFLWFIAILFVLALSVALALVVKRGQ